MYYPIPTVIGPNRATLDIIGLYNYDSGLFDDLVVPASISKDDVVHEILETCAELEVLYPDWDFMKSAIGHWSAVEMATWNRVEALALAEYNPIENYDRKEYAVDTGSRQAQGSGTQKAIANSTSSGNTLDQVAGYNSDTLSTAGKQTDVNASASQGSNESQSQTSEAETNVRQFRAHGNIGVTTVAEMMAGELDVYPRINLINYIVESFKLRFCLLVY